MILYKYVKKIILCLFVFGALSFLVCGIAFASYNPDNPYNMYWKSFGDGTFAWVPKSKQITNIVKKGAWYQYEDGRWSFFMSSDGGNTFFPIKSCSAYINFNDNPVYNLFTFDSDGIVASGEIVNVEFPPQDMLFVNIYATNLHLRLQPGGMCVQDETILKSSNEGPLKWR